MKCLVLQTNFIKVLTVVNRRHIRVKVMQSIYAMHQNGSDNLRGREVPFHSIDNIQDLYLTMISSLMEICKRETVFYINQLKTSRYAWERKPNEKFIKNSIFQILAENNS
jgi:N utilization substance protein B